MTYVARFLQGTTLVLMASPAMAQITAQDVWDNQMAVYDALGLDVTATPELAQGTMTVTGIVVTYALPMGVGSVFIESPDMTLVEQSDGTVIITYPATARVAAGGDFSLDGETGGATVALDLTMTGFVSTASGTPGDITYVTQAGLIDMAMGDLTISPDPGMDDFLFDTFITISDYAATTRTTVGDRITMVTENTSGRTIYDVAFSDGMGTASRSVGQVASTVSGGTIVLPRAPLNVMNLAVAFRDGLSFEARTDALDTQSQSIQTVDDAMLSDQRQTVDRTEQTLRLDQSGLVIDGTASGIMIDIAMDMTIPFPVQVGLTSASGGFRMPISASPDPQPIGLSFDMQGLTVNDELWNIADPTAAFARDPATIAFALNGEVINEVELFDFMSLAALEARFMTGDLPFQLQSLSLTGLNLAALGVAVTGEGAFTFDNADTFTYAGFPRPVGTASATVTGANAMLDKLSELGWLSADEIMGFRMGLAMAANPAGDDMLTSTLEMTADGQVIVNGQRMQ